MVRTPQVLLLAGGLSYGQDKARASIARAIMQFADKDPR